MANEVSAALTNHAIRTIKTELGFLTDSSAISPQQCSAILSQLPAETQLRPALQSSTPNAAQQFSNVQIDHEKLNHTPVSVAAAVPPPPPPPAYASGLPMLSLAISLYAYAPTDAGDLALEQNDRVQVTEHMNNDWWRGRNERTGLEGIFPRSYVEIMEEKGFPSVLPQSTPYGNMPSNVSQSSGSLPQAEVKKPSKFEDGGKKFGKKMGNAAIFGAGATVGSKIVNGIF